MSSLKAIKISEHVYWVGAVDWGVRNFHGYTTSRGTTYNAFLIMADKITLIDTVKVGFTTEMLARIASLVDPAKIDYIVSNHAEPDHSGSLVEVVKTVCPEKVFASRMGIKALKRHYPTLGDSLVAVEDGEELSLGNLRLQFWETRMLHWPDSMFAYLVEEKMLFSQDAFGMHLASSERFDDELPWDLLLKQAQDYYANIITLYSPFVAKLFERLKANPLDLAMVAPDHGPIWRNMENFNRLLSWYLTWSSRKLEKKAVIIYDTMWHSTEEMAKYVEDGLRSGGVKVVTLPLYASNRSEVASEMIDASALLVGGPTLNNNIYPSLADVLTYLRGLRFKTPFGGAFGSYGWSGEGVAQIKAYLSEMGTEIVGEVKTQYVADPESLEKCHRLGLSVAAKINECF
jgi:flavorubredoxin